MKTVIFFLTLFFNSILFATNYYISHDKDNHLLIKTGSFEVKTSLKELLSVAKEGDVYYFKRGEYFNLNIEIKSQKNLSFFSYGDKNKPLPIIDTSTKIIIDQTSLDIIYDVSKKRFYDKSWREIEKDFSKYYNIQSTVTKKSIAKDFKEVRGDIVSMARFKLSLPKYGYYDPNAMRIFYGNKELLKVLLFEEFKCKECKEKIRWYFEQKSGYLYIFTLSQDIDIEKVVNNLSINNDSLSAFGITDSQNIMIKGLDLRGGKYALLIKASKNIKVFDSNIGNYSFTGVYIISDKTPSSHITIANSLIDSKFYFKNYRFYSSRGSQDGIFLIGNVHSCIIKKCDINNWGHNGITLYSVDETNRVSNNYIALNKISGKEIAYMHGIIVDNKYCTNNKIVSNLITDISAPNQINGMSNTFENNTVISVKNSSVKKDQGYGSGIALQIQAYGKDNAAIGNIIKNNSFINCESEGLSLYDNGYDGVKKNNIIKENRFVNCSINPFNKQKGVYIEVSKYHPSNMINNSFVKNLFYEESSKLLIDYKGEYLDIDAFNKVKGNKDNEIISPLLIDEDEIIQNFELERKKSR